MKKLIYFNSIDCPETIEQTNLIDSVEMFIEASGELLTDAEVIGNKLLFTKALSEENEPIKGYAMIFDVPNDFNN